MPSEQTQPQTIGSALVVGGGIGGMQAALDLAASGIKVYLTDRRASIGGVMAQLDKTFPTNDCAMCTMAPRLVEIGRHRDIEILTLSDVARVEGQPGDFTVTVKRQPSFVDEAKCTGCGSCVSNCPTRNHAQPLVSPRVELELAYREAVGNSLARHKNQKGPLMPILQEVNAALNYFPQSVLAYIAQETGYPLSHIYRIATFYSAFSVVPRGRYAINVCMGTTCYVRGSQRLMDRFADTLKIKPEETTPDKLFTLKAVRCVGCCGLAPAVMVGDTVYGKLTVKEVSGIARKYQGVDGHAKAHTG
jgi:NADH:ubiquinone oxidoreductase subunit E/NAD-dependent dihydropyrimidine dehydrogenase PreA subunit